jgi:hypothetical protein
MNRFRLFATAVTAFVSVLPGSLLAGWHHHHRHHGAPVYYAAPVYAAPMYSAPGAQAPQSGLVELLLPFVLKQITSGGGVGGGSGNSDYGYPDNGGSLQSVRNDLQQMQADLAAARQESKAGFENVGGVLARHGAELKGVRDDLDAMKQNLAVVQQAVDSNSQLQKAITEIRARMPGKSKEEVLTTITTKLHEIVNGQTEFKTDAQKKKLIEDITKEVEKQLVEAYK